MKVILITPSYHPIVGGSETLTRTLATKLDALNVHTDVMTLNMTTKWNPSWNDNLETHGSVTIHKVAAVNPFHQSAMNLLYTFARTNVIPKPGFVKTLQSYDLIHFIGEADLSFPLFSLSVKKPKILQCVATYLLLRYYWKHRSFRQLFKHLFPHLATHYMISHTAERPLLSELGVPLSKIIELPIGVDVNAFRPDEKRRRNDLLLFVGRIERIKGVHLLLDALSYLNTPVQLAIIGPRWEKNYAKLIEQRCHTINNRGVHHVEMLGTLDQGSLTRWYQKATIVVCPYLVEPFSNITREALACGTPVVSTGTHILDTTPDGIHLVSKNAQTLAATLSQLLVDKKTRRNVGRQGRRAVETFLSWESIAQKLVKIYTHMCIHSNSRTN